jgi:hypothetical protein
VYERCAAAAADADEERVLNDGVCDRVGLAAGVCDREGEMGLAAGVEGRAVMEADLEWNRETGVWEAE